MTDKVQKIREEVARIQLYTQSEVLKKVLDYIDKVQEEPIGKVWHYQKEDPIDDIADKSRPIVVIYGYNSLNAAGKFRCYEDNSKAIWLSNSYEKWAFVEDLINLSHSVVKTGDKEEPVSEELKVELEKYIKDHFTIDTEQLDRFGIEEKDYMYSMDKSDMLALVEHFTNWQKTKEEPVSEELEEASKKWLIPQLDKSYANYGEGMMMELTHFDGYAMLDAIEFGAKWQKLQDMGITNKAQDVVDDVLSSADSPLDAYATEVAFIMLPANLTENYHMTNRGRISDAVRLGAKWQKANLWKPADGDDLPEYEREVVAFQEIFPTDVDVPSLLKIVIAHRPNPEGYDGKSIATGKVEHYTPKTYDKGGWNIPDVKYWLDIDIPKIEED